MDLRPFIRDIPDFPKKGIQFKDITPLLADPTAFQVAIDLLSIHYAGAPIDAVAAAEARGFLFAAPLALKLHKPLVPHSLKYELEYGSAELQMHVDGVSKGQRVLLVDDVLATGGTMLAGAKLIEQAGAAVAGCAFLVELGFLEGRKKLTAYDCFSLLTY
jgi:adenine phosphoribosyltransferase